MLATNMHSNELTSELLFFSAFIKSEEPMKLDNNKKLLVLRYTMNFGSIKNEKNCKETCERMGYVSKKI